MKRTARLNERCRILMSVVDKARALEKMPDFRPGKQEAESMRATGTDGRIAPESVDTKFDTNRNDKGLFQAMNSYKVDIGKPSETDGHEINKPLASKGLGY